MPFFNTVHSNPVSLIIIWGNIIQSLVSYDKDVRVQIEQTNKQQQQKNIFTSESPISVKPLYYTLNIRENSLNYLWPTFCSHVIMQVE